MCYKCGKEGHYARGCTAKILNDNWQTKNQGSQLTSLQALTEGPNEEQDKKNVLEPNIRIYAYIKYGKKYRSLVHWYETNETIVTTPKFVENTTNAIKKFQARMKSAQSQQKFYADKRRRPLEFQIGDSVFLKVAPMKGVMQFEKKRKLSPRYIGPFKTLERICKVAFRLALPPEL